MEVPRDCDGVARVRSACFPAWPVTGEQVAEAEARRPRARLHVPCVAVSGDALAGYGFVEEPNVAVRIASYRQLALALADAPRRLYDLDAVLWSDVPFGVTGSPPTFEEYQATELADPGFLPEAAFIALDRDAWVGICTLTNGPGYVLNAMTGVTRAWRGRGLARWLKLHSIRCALERGAAEIRTFNDAVNEPILALNRALGFRVVSTELRYRKELR